MKKKYYILINCIVIILLTSLDFTKEVKEVSVIVPEEVASFEPVTPIEVVRVDTFLIKGKTVVKKVENRINEKLLREYQNLRDSVSRLEKYKAAVMEREYKHTFKDTIQEITVHTKSVGEVTSQSVSYKVHERKITVPVKVRSTSLYVGMATRLTPNFEAVPTIFLQNKKTLFAVGLNPTNKGIEFAAAIKFF